MLATEHSFREEGLSMQLHEAQQLLTVEQLAQVRTALLRHISWIRLAADPCVWVMQSSGILRAKAS